MTTLRPMIIVYVIGISVVALLSFLIIIPEYINITSTRHNLDLIRSSLESIQRQQNTSNASSDFIRLSHDRDELKKLFLTTEGSISYFTDVDQVYESLNLTEVSMRLDKPIQGTPLQTLGVHYTFKGTYEQTIQFLKSIVAQKP